VTVFLGTPVHAPAGVGNLRGEQSFPAAARTALADTQLRRNLGTATATIRTKRAAAVAEVPDWEQLRLAGSALKADVLARLPELLELLEQEVPRPDRLIEVVLPYANGALVSRVHDEGEVLVEEHLDEGTRMQARVRPDLAAELEAYAVA